MEEPNGFAGRVRFVKAPQQLDGSDTSAIEATVREVIAAVRTRGDAALRDYSRKFDGVAAEAIEVNRAECNKAIAALEPQSRRDTEFAIGRVRE